MRFLKKTERGMKKEAGFVHGLITVVILAAAMFYCVVLHGSSPQIPLMIGCTAAALMAAFLGYSWEELLGFMIDGITQSLEAILILLLIGCLVGVWIASGTVPAMICYGLSVLNAKYFLMASALICGLVSFAIGAWGTVGTVGIALMGIGSALNIPLPLVAGSVVSGAYFGDVVSPLSDATNLSAAVVGCDVFSMIRARLIPTLTSFVLACGIYFFAGLRFGGGESGQVASAVAPLQQSLRELYSVSPLCLLPMAVVIVCILRKVPAIPAMLLGVVSGGLTAVLGQNVRPADLIAVCSEGNVCNSGTELIDTLLTAGGISSMLNTISIIVIAMAFGGLMQRTGQMRALAAPLLRHVRGFAGMNAVSAVSCVLMNIVLPDQYLGISVPGQMLQEEYDRRHFSRPSLGVGLAGGAVSSPLVPWNTCGLYCCAILGVGAGDYLKHAYFNFIMLAVLLIWGFFGGKGRGAGTDG